MIAGILIALILSVGWRYWQQYHIRILTQASIMFDEMLTARAQGNKNVTAMQANQIWSHYPHTSYAQMSAFMLARTAVNQKQYAEAENNLNWVIAHNTDKTIQQIARLRLARVYIQENKPTLALDLLKKTDDATFTGLIDEVRGDAYIAMNNVSAAREAYQIAFKEIPNAEATRPLLQMKLENLANK